MKVLFLNPPFFPMYSRESRSPSVTKSSTLYWPMFLAYAAGSAEADGNEILLLDAPAMDLGRDEVLNRAAEFGAEAAVLQTSTPSIHNDVEVAAALKRKLPALKTVLIGPHVSAEPVETLEMGDAADYVVVGEADRTVRDLIRSLRGDAGAVPAEELPGVASRTPGGVRVNPEGPKIEDLDSLPWVSKVYRRHLHSCYRRYFYGANLNPIVVILAGRGCPFRCTYCVIPQTLMGHAYRKRSPKDVVDELEYIVGNFDPLGEVFFEDDTFTSDRKQTAAICEEILKRGLKLTWSANARADVPEELLLLMKKAGCRELCVGFESASPEVLKNIRKGLPDGSQERFVAAARKAGILIHGCFMVGNKGDTRETLEATLEFAKRLNPNTAQFYPIMAYPGTEAFAELRAAGRLKTTDYREWLDRNGFHNTTVVCDNLSSQELVDFCDRARREFYLRPGYVLRQVSVALRNPKERYRLMRGFGTLVKHLFKRHGDAAK